VRDGTLYTVSKLREHGWKWGLSLL